MSTIGTRGARSRRAGQNDFATSGWIVALVVSCSLLTGTARRAVALQIEQPAAPAAAPVAEPAADAESPRTVEIIFTPAGEPYFALQRRLLPAAAERKPGNAAPFYYRAFLQRKNLAAESDKTFSDNYERWLAWPPQEADLAAMREWIGRYQGPVFHELRTAVYREQCEWDYRVRDFEGFEVLSFLLEEAQEARAVARALQIQARIELAEGRWDAAFETLRNGYQLAQDVARPPILIDGLVGLAIGGLMTDELEHLVAAKDAPNLYWALASLPRPFIDMRPSVEQEVNTVEQIFPFFKDAETAQRSPAEWRRLFAASIEKLDQLEVLGAPAADGGRWRAELVAGAMAVVAYPRAKQALIESGLPADKVESMPVAQVIAIQTARASRHAAHEVFKWNTLPYYEASRFFDSTEKELQQAGYLNANALQLQGAFPVVALLLPATKMVAYSSLRLDRRLCALRIVEAIRMYAAQHEGRLPTSLAEITRVPIPRDPLTNEPFPYRLEGTRAILDVPPGMDLAQRNEAYRYVMTVRRD